MSSVRLAITGASGLIGSALVKFFLDRGEDVVPLSRSNNEYLATKFGVPVINCDVLNMVPDLEGIEYLIHCATANDIVSKNQDGGLALSVLGTQRLLHQAVKSGVKNVIFFSTVQVYGTELTGKISEASEVRCQTAYGLNHYLGEKVCEFYATAFNLNIAVVRPSNVFGLPISATVSRRTLVPTCFVDDAFANHKITLLSSGRQKRNFISLTELCNQIGVLVDSFPDNFTVSNIVSPWHASILEVAQMVSQSWAGVVNNKLEVEIMSDNPHAGNNFELISNLRSPSISAEGSKNQMRSTIDAMIKQKETLL